MAQAARLNLRMQKELKLLLSDPPPGASFPLLSSDSLASSSSALTTMEAQLEGPEGTVYGGGIFSIKIQIPDRYPFQPPSVTFATPIYHPNIDTGGRICLDILNLPPKGAWQPSLNVSTVLTSIRLLLSEPNPDDGLMCDASREYKYNKEAFDQKARAMTEKYAKTGTGVLADANESIQKESKRTGEHSLPEPSAHVIRPHIKLGLHSQKLSLQSFCGTKKGNDHGDSCDFLSNSDFLPEPKKKLDGEKIKKSEAVTDEHDRNHGNSCQTRRKLCLDSSSQVCRGNFHCKSGDPGNIQSNNQNIRGVSLKTSVRQVEERPGQYHEHQDNRASNIGSARMYPDDKQPIGHLDTFRKSDGVDKKTLVTHRLTPMGNHCTAINQVPTKSPDHIKHHNQEVPIRRVKNGSTGQSSKKLCPIGKKLSLGSKYASLLDVNGNKENLMSNHLKLPLESQKNILSSNECSTASQMGENQETGSNSDFLDVTRRRRVANMKPSQGPLTTLHYVNDGNVQLLSNSENVAGTPSESAHDQIYLPSKKHCPSKEISNDRSNEQDATVESPIQEEVIVLDSEDSEEESIDFVRPRLLVGRKPLRKWK